MAAFLDPKSGNAIGYRETKGTTAEPFNVPMLWQASSLSYVTMLADVSGNLMTAGGGGGGGNAAAGLTGAAVPTSADYTGFNLAGNLVGVSVANPLPTSAVGNTAASGTINANGQNVTITVPSGAGGVGIQITGAWTGQIDFQATIDGTNWVSTPTSNGVSSINATAFNGVFIVAGGGYGQIRALSTSWTSGTATLTMNASVGAGPALLSGPLPQGINLLGSIITTRSSTANSPAAVSIGVASTSVLGSNASRKGLTLVNTSAANISVAFGATAVLNSGVTLVPFGSFTMDDYDFATGTVNAIASLAASNLAVQEWQ